MANSVGLIVARPARMLGFEPFFMELIAGIEETLSEKGVSLLLHIVPDHESEIVAYRRWRSGNMVRAVILVNMRVEDTRLAVLEELGLPTVVVGDEGIGYDGAAVLVDNATAMRGAVGHLAEAGHRRIAQVTGPTSLRHTRLRSAAFEQQTRDLGVESIIIEGDYSEAAGARATADLLALADTPTAIVYDNDVMAVAGLAEAVGARRRIPDDLSLLAWDDSVLCRLASPALSAMSHDVHTMGTLASRCVLDMLANGQRVVRHAPLPVLVSRATTGPAPVRH
jgi:DNA-binding LacI/PurR family transcriptional regulator